MFIRKGAHAPRSKLIEDLDAVPGLWERHGRYATSDYVMRLALTLIAGGEGLEDARLAPNSLGDFPRRFGHMTISRLKRVNARQVRRALAQRGPGHLTLDVDSSLIESDKKEAQKTCAGFAHLFSCARAQLLSRGSGTLPVPTPSWGRRRPS